MSGADNVIDLMKITDILSLQQLTESVNWKRLSKINVGLLVPLNLPLSQCPGSQAVGVRMQDTIVLNKLTVQATVNQDFQAAPFHLDL